MMMKRLLAYMSVVLMGVSTLVAEERVPTADELLAGARYAATMQKNQKINGTLRKKSDKIPFGIELKDGDIFFNYSVDGSDWRTFQLKFKEAGQELYTYEAGKSKKFESKRYGERIGNTDVTFEDLSFRFLYWPKGQVLPQDRTSFVKGRKCYVVNLPNPKPGDGEYAWIRVWIDAENGAMWQIDAFNADGKLLKRFAITSVMKSKDTWFFKQMRVETRDPNNQQKVLAVNYIELEPN